MSGSIVRMDIYCMYGCGKEKEKKKWKNLLVQIPQGGEGKALKRVNAELQIINSPRLHFRKEEVASCLC